LAALDFLADVAARDCVIGLFHGPSLSGKTTILESFARSIDEHMALAVVDGAGTETGPLLNEVLGQFGYELEFNTTNELINMLRVFVLQQATSNKPPLLIIENVHAMMPAALGALCEFAALRVRDRSALRLILASDRSLETMIRAPAMAEAVAQREITTFQLEPMADFETRNYVYAKLKAGGCTTPARVFPEDVCLELYEASSGWPGQIDRLAAVALARAEKLPVTSELIDRTGTFDELPALIDAECDWEADEDATPPTLIVSHEGETLQQFVMDSKRILIGRSEHNDLRIASRFISRHHALFVRHGKSTFLMDLNSTNGTFVNSRRISNLMMKHEDIVQLGQHRIKFLDPSATERARPDDAELSETVVMKSLEDVRRLLLRESTEAVSDDDSSATAER
ncbi:MAG TPA: FHA domain-containing protein, partial [Woeseiaceae bacterium]|nr:FHA domain-containing protein [Woeseiaceae bacterium]